MSSPASSSAARRLPLWLKVAFTAFLAVLVPFYWSAYGPTNFLYFCDVALFFALAALWLESPLLASMPTVGILIPQMLWLADFGAGMVGATFLGMTDYMFRESIPLFARGLSLFHGWLPFLLLWLVWQLGYDRRALLAWTLLAWGLLLVRYFFMPAPPPDPCDPDRPVNINYVYGFDDNQAQTTLPANQYFVVFMASVPVLVFLPTHLLLKQCFPAAGERPGK